MTMLFFFKPIYHQGPSVGTLPSDAVKKKPRKPKVTKKFVERVAEHFELTFPDVRGYVEDILPREAEIIRLKEQAIRAAEIEAKRRAEEEAQQRIKELIEQVGIMVRKAAIAKRKRLNIMIAAAFDLL